MRPRWATTHDTLPWRATTFPAQCDSRGAGGTNAARRGHVAAIAQRWRPCMEPRACGGGDDQQRSGAGPCPGVIGERCLTWGDAAPCQHAPRHGPRARRPHRAVTIAGRPRGELLLLRW